MGKYRPDKITRYNETLLEECFERKHLFLRLLLIFGFRVVYLIFNHMDARIARDLEFATGVSRSFWLARYWQGKINV